jgi:hypothetical protein
MKTITSVSGGMTSAYLAANYPTDYLLFALVRIEHEKCKFKDEVLRKRVEDKIQKPFIATAEDDKIIYTIFDLEQYLGREITWVSGLTYDELIKTKGGWLPNKMHRYCTTSLKIDPMVQWWYANINEPIVMNIGFRANETERANRMLKKTNANGLIEHHSVIGKHKSGKNKWAYLQWQKPNFPLIEKGILKNEIVNYWKDKPVRFAAYNNCVGCFHRNPVFLRWMFQQHPEKMEWFASQEGGKNGYWKSVDGEVIPYARIKNMLKQTTLFETDFTSCDAGYCEI